MKRLAAESVHSKNVDEWISQARVTAERAWFTNASLYESFVELKNYVLQGKLTGNDSAESIYMRLTGQFSEADLEPLQLYYLSALTGATFEAQLRMDVERQKIEREQRSAAFKNAVMDQINLANNPAVKTTLGYE